MQLDKLEERLNTATQIEMCMSCYGITSEGSLCLDCLGAGYFKEPTGLSFREQKNLVSYAKTLESLVKDLRGYL